MGGFAEHTGAPVAQSQPKGREIPAGDVSVGWGEGKSGNGQTGMDPAPLNLTAAGLC